MRYVDRSSHLFHSLVIVLLLAGCASSSAGPARQGDRAPVVAVTTLAGEQTELSRQPDEALWLNFWASWCRPCQIEWSGLNQAQHNLVGYRVRLVAVSVNESTGTVRTFLDTHPAAFTVLLDPHGELAARYGVIGFPTHILIDKAGIVRAIVRGPLDEVRAHTLLHLTE